MGTVENHLCEIIFGHATTVPQLKGDTLQSLATVLALHLWGFRRQRPPVSQAETYILTGAAPIATTIRRHICCPVRNLVLLVEPRLGDFLGMSQGLFPVLKVCRLMPKRKLILRHMR